MARDDLVQLEGEVTEIGNGGKYLVKLSGVDEPSSEPPEIQAKLCGKMRRFNIRVVVGDKVTVGVSPYDHTHGLILYRHK